MRRYRFDITLSEQELKEIIAALCGVDANKEVFGFRTILAKRLEQTLWNPFFADVALGRRQK